MRAWISTAMLSVYIDGVEVDYISLPRFTGSYCSYWSIEQWQRDQLNKSLDKAKEIVERFIADGREDATPAEIKKAYSRL